MDLKLGMELTRWKSVEEGNGEGKVRTTSTNKVTNGNIGVGDGGCNEGCRKRGDSRAAPGWSMIESWEGFSRSKSSVLPV